MWQALLGILVFTAIPVVLSENRRAISPRLVLACLALQFAIAWLMLRITWVQDLLLGLNSAVKVLEQAALAGSSYMFGYLGGAELPFEADGPGTPFIIAFQVLPIVLVMSALSAILFYWGILQRVIGGLGFLLQKVLRLDGLQTFAVASSVFFGIVEAPLLVRPYFESMSRSTLFLLITAAMSTVAGTVMVLYASQLEGIIANPAGHILVASLISMPAAVLFAQLWVPPADRRQHHIPPVHSEAQSTLDALVRGTEDGVKLLLNIIGMIMVLFALIYLVNALLGALFGEGITLEYLASFLFHPIVWLMGVDSADLGQAAELMSIKLIFNEFVAYQRIAELGPDALSPHSYLVLVYAICGFANFASLGLVVGTISTIVPGRTAEVAYLATRALFAGLLATCMTGTVVGLLHPG
ncbi:NupC/NupG family nucleoside CNT transporter [Microbulbifer yueqingensis]|uniref:Concentrative nucleoside transporter, CNT family n=1 Tax=Microbulbifer yueqingensis TaxID=658219 RepID=A0A1G9BVW0_9GAMM|nr:nucleoside transporter C-terminal domain-containing protein [Microbulbifer yueqingensis]SDK43294.1 concentrative nucleoside transporter, CNT family [Microbulbifer yueqingensis]